MAPRVGFSKKTESQIMARRTVLICFLAGHKKIKNKASAKLEECERGGERPRVDQKQQNKFTLD